MCSPRPRVGDLDAIHAAAVRTAERKLAAYQQFQCAIALEALEISGADARPIRPARPAAAALPSGSPCVPQSAAAGCHRRRRLRITRSRRTARHQRIQPGGEGCGVEPGRTHRIRLGHNGITARIWIASPSGVGEFGCVSVEFLAPPWPSWWWPSSGVRLRDITDDELAMRQVLNHTAQPIHNLASARHSSPTGRKASFGRSGAALLLRRQGPCLPGGNGGARIRERGVRGG